MSTYRRCPLTGGAHVCNSSTKQYYNWGTHWNRGAYSRELKGTTRTNFLLSELRAVRDYMIIEIGSSKI